MSTTRAAEEILKTLVAFDTTSSDSNMALIEWVEQYLDTHGVWHERVQEHDEHGIKKTSLLARIGPAVEGGIVLSGHTDVVPVTGQQWTGGQGAQTAFTLTERDGKLYGRGASDMKGFLALALAQVPEFVAQEQRGELKRPVWLAFSHDEEIGCKCAEPMAKEFMARDVKPALIVVGEPTLMQVVDEHKGIDSFETIIRGKAGHSSAPELGTNAGYIMAELALTLRDINAAERSHASASESRFPTPHSTVHAGIFHAGTARNIIPDHAELKWEVRPLPGRAVEEVLAPYYAKIAQLQQRYPDCTIDTHQLTHVHGLKRQSDEAIQLANYLAGSNAAATAVNYGTEGGAMGSYGFPTVICGPGSIDQAHQPDEYIARSELAKGAAMMARVGEVLSRAAWVARSAGRDEAARER
ncbi:MAG: acetylornithine deacetylase [Azospirillum brasilense]|nr:MAG: acetylornithine deacetylase [Azospirillum brasilense]